MSRADDPNVVIELLRPHPESPQEERHRPASVALSRQSPRIGVCCPNMKSPLKVAIYAGGILVSYAVFGILQEKILRGQYGPEKKRFEFQFSLLLVQCVMNSLMAKVLLHTIWKQGVDLTHYTYYAVASIFYFGAMLTSFTALKYVNYPTQVVAKSCKPIPVMILGVLLARKRYSLLKYFFVTLIVIGVSMFIYKDKQTSSVDSGLEFFGNILLIISLSGDGLLGAVQDRMRQNFQTKSLHMMWQINVFAVAYISIALAYTGELPAFIGFVRAHPQLYTEITLFAITSAVGQIFIYSTVAEFGPLVCSIVTTTRKFFTVLGSVLLFGNTLSDRQWIGTAFVFAGLFLDAFYGKSAQTAKKA